MAEIIDLDEHRRPGLLPEPPPWVQLVAAQGVQAMLSNLEGYDGLHPVDFSDYEQAMADHIAAMLTEVLAYGLGRDLRPVYRYKK